MTVGMCVIFIRFAMQVIEFIYLLRVSSLGGIEFRSYIFAEGTIKLIAGERLVPIRYFKMITVYNGLTKRRTIFYQV